VFVLLLVFVCSASVFVLRVFADSGMGAAPKTRVRLGRSGVAQILRNSIDTYPRRLSGHQVLENGRSGYADEEDHEQDCERTVSLEAIDGHE
jgi:hypothetical protein